MAKDEVISPLLMNMIKPFLPGLIQKVSSVGPFLKTQIEAIELLPGENCAGFLILIDDFDNEPNLLVVTFDESGNAKREVEKHNLVQFIQERANEAIKSMQKPSKK